MAKAPPVSAVLPAADEKAVAVRRMFDQIAPRYDLLNHLLSLNIDKRWRRRAVDVLVARSAASSPSAMGTPRQGSDLSIGGGPPARPTDGLVLDACAGTLDLALELARRPSFTGRVVASDFTYAMLDRGRDKIGGARLSTTCADALQLPFADGTFSGAMVAFGVRNLGDLDQGLREAARVLEPGSPLVILEFTTPRWQPFRALYLTYFRHVLPLIGRAVSRHGSAYDYLPASVLEFPEPPQLAARMSAAGFAEVRWETLTGGIVAVHSAVRS
jgi:demethylmenaquinone methyltransferase / 2-methoxy-6-polyprenyl-1,4-benzoquinol methylase